MQPGRLQYEEKCNMCSFDRSHDSIDADRVRQCSTGIDRGFVRSTGSGILCSGSHERGSGSSYIGSSGGYIRSGIGRSQDREGLRQGR